MLDVILAPEALTELDPFDRVQLAEVIRICRHSRSLSEAGRTLFAAIADRRIGEQHGKGSRRHHQRRGRPPGHSFGNSRPIAR